MATDAFGLGGTPPEELLGLTEEAEEPEGQTEEAPEETTPQEPVQAAEGTPSEEEAPEAEAETQTDGPEGSLGTKEAPQASEQEEVEVAVAEEPTPEPEEEPRLWAGKYTSPEDLERGYSESTRMHQRAAEARKAEEQRAYEAEVREAELAKILTEALPYLNAASEREKMFHTWAERQRQETGQYPEGYTGPPSNEPKPLAPADVNRLVEERLAVERRQMQEQYAQQQEYEATNTAVMGFYEDHPEVAPYSPADNGITETMQVLNEAWSQRNEVVDMSDRGTIEILYEASQRPAFRQVLALKPDYFDSAEGLTLARMEASVLEGAPGPGETQETRQVPASRAGRPGQRKPFAEAAVTGAEAQEEESDDPWTQIKQEYAKSKNKASVFEFE